MLSLVDSDSTPTHAVLKFNDGPMEVNFRQRSPILFCMNLSLFCPSVGAVSFKLFESHCMGYFDYAAPSPVPQRPRPWQKMRCLSLTEFRPMQFVVSDGRRRGGFNFLREISCSNVGAALKLSGPCCHKV